MRTPMYCLLFADDIASLTTTSKSLQNQTGNLYKLGIKINVNTTKIIY
jgi:hypothetical protein